MEMQPNDPPRSDEDRRAFLKACGRFAAVTPPAVTILLSTSLHSGAIAASGGGGDGGRGSAGPRDTGGSAPVLRGGGDRGTRGGGDRG